MINLRNALMGKRLPYDAEVEYIGSTGTQYIITDFFPAKFSWRVEWEGKNATWGWIHNNVASGTWICGQFDDGVAYVFYGDFNKRHATRRLSATQSYKYIFDTDLGVWINEEYKGTSPISIGIDTITTNLPLFANFDFYDRRYKFKATATAPTTLRYFRVKVQGVDMLDMIPVRLTNENNQTEGAMYDRRGVGGMNPDGSARTDGLYFNQGTGDFVLGPDKNA